MKLRRTIASIPVRSAVETWSEIVNLISTPKSVDRGQLLACAPDLASIIADELPARAPIVVKGGGGPRLVIYCAYGAEAVELGTDIDPIDWNPTEGPGWSITAPAEAADLGWLKQALERLAPRVSVHDVDVPPEEDSESVAAAGAIQIDWDKAR
jgi:hypothetical protein